MNQLTRPFVQVWEYFGRVGGYPGQLFFAIVVIILILGGLTWLGNRK